MSLALAANFKKELALCKSQLPNTRRWIIAFSGGLDSTALLALCAATLPKDSLIAVYIDHQLQAHSSDWARHCKDQCLRFGIEFESFKVSPQSSSEESAREARYACLETFIQQDDVVLLGQHADDQAETFLFRLLRGSGVQGLSGMPKLRRLGRGWLVRPLLGVSKMELNAYLAAIKLEWVEDPSNAQIAYRRNWIRHVLGPCITERWPGWRETLNRTAVRLAEADQLNRDLACLDLGGKINIQPLSINSVRNLTPVRIKNALYYWLREHNISVSSELQVLEICTHIAKATETGRWVFGGYAVHLYRDALYLDLQPNRVLQPRKLQISEIFFDLGAGALGFEIQAMGLPAGLSVEVRARRPGEKISIKHRGGSVSLKKLMSEQAIPPWLRDSWPILEFEGRVVAVPSLWVDPDLQISQGLTPIWRY